MALDFLRRAAAGTGNENSRLESRGGGAPGCPAEEPYRSLRVFLTAAAATAGILAVGQTSITIQSAHAAEVLRITDLLRSGLVPQTCVQGYMTRLALIPGVTASEPANLDGKTGVAIGRTEPLGGGLGAEIIIDPNTGLVIRKGSIMTSLRLLDACT